VCACSCERVAKGTAHEQTGMQQRGFKIAGGELAMTRRLWLGWAFKRVDGSLHALRQCRITHDWKTAGIGLAGRRGKMREGAGVGGARKVEAEAGARKEEVVRVQASSCSSSSIPCGGGGTRRELKQRGG
jgi:hypothetical protein